MSWTTVVDVGEAALVDFTLRTGLGLVLAVWEMQCLRAGRGCDGVVRGCLCCVPLIVIFTGSLKDTFRAVFLKLAWPW